MSIPSSGKKHLAEVGLPVNPRYNFLFHTATPGLPKIGDQFDVVRQLKPQRTRVTLSYDANRRITQILHGNSAGGGLYDGMIHGSPTFGSVKFAHGLMEVT